MVSVDVKQHVYLLCLPVLSSFSHWHGSPSTRKALKLDVIGLRKTYTVCRRVRASFSPEILHGRGSDGVNIRCPCILVLCMQFSQVTVMIQFRAQSSFYDYNTCGQLLWETTDRDVSIIALSEPGRKKESCNVTVRE